MKISKLAFRMINALTWYRIFASPVLLALIFADQVNAFKWMLALSFLTDAIDGPLARKFHIAGERGAQLDSLGDDLTVGVALVGMFRWNYEFLADHWEWMLILPILLVFEVSYAILKFGKMTAFHTYFSKAAAVLQGLYLCTFFFMGQPNKYFFYLTIVVTAIGLLEEIILVNLVKEYRCNVKGIYWLFQQFENDRRQFHRRLN
ncbi:CDP-alcohol phosphatidyltransferase family protein [Pedobacter sp. Du54]|uniref:CDP-alcohol phosphatidyltransferase family protein n=1 Tax=Pedobacter anseongensis TaxID=3133439 RepID=UPI00309E92C9